MNSRRSLSKCPLLCAALAAVAVTATSASAQADEAAYCRKVRARAAADAALLEAPQVLAEAIRAPSGLQPGGKLDPTTPGHGYQIRAGFTFSPLDLYRGTRITVVAGADCEQHEAVTAAQEMLIHAPELGRLAALRDQAAFLDAERPSWEGVVAKMSARFAAQTATLVDLETVRAQTSGIARQRAQIAGEIAHLEATGLADYRGSIPALIRQIHDKSMSFEREASHVRSLDAWKVNITGGYLPPIYGPGTSDFFGVVQVAYSLGGPWHNAEDGRYLSARAEELSKSRQETERQLQLLVESVRAASVQASRELEIVERRIAEIDSLRIIVAASDASSAGVALAHLDLDKLSAQADRVFLASLVRELSRLEIN